MVCTLFGLPKEKRIYLLGNSMMCKAFIIRMLYLLYIFVVDPVGLGIHFKIVNVNN